MRGRCLSCDGVAMEGRSMSNDRALHRSQKRRDTTFYSLLLYLPIITFITLSCLDVVEFV